MNISYLEQKTERQNILHDKKRLQEILRKKFRVLSGNRPCKIYSVIPQIYEKRLHDMLLEKQDRFCTDTARGAYYSLLTDDESKAVIASSFFLGNNMYFDALRELRSLEDKTARIMLAYLDIYANLVLRHQSDEHIASVLSSQIVEILEGCQEINDARFFYNAAYILDEFTNEKELAKQYVRKLYSSISHEPEATEILRSTLSIGVVKEDDGLFESGLMHLKKTRRQGSYFDLLHHEKLIKRVREQRKERDIKMFQTVHDQEEEMQIKGYDTIDELVEILDSFVLDEHTDHYPADFYENIATVLYAIYDENTSIQAILAEYLEKTGRPFFAYDVILSGKKMQETYDHDVMLSFAELAVANTLKEHGYKEFEIRSQDAYINALLHWQELDTSHIMRWYKSMMRLITYADDHGDPVRDELCSSVIDEFSKNVLEPFVLYDFYISLKELGLQEHLKEVQILLMDQCFRYKKNMNEYMSEKRIDYFDPWFVDGIIKEVADDRF